MQDPIDRLLSEHRSIMKQVAGLRDALADLRARGEAAVPECLPVLRSVGGMMATELEAHARREDEALFPAIEAVLGGGGGPTTVMREEHREIHAGAARFRATLRELEEVEHPAIVAGGAALRAQAASGARASELEATAAGVIRLLDAHFSKEESVLFPMARQVLDSGTLAEVERKMEEVGAR